MSSSEDQKSSTASRFKRELMVVAFVVSLVGLFWGAILANNWLKFGSYRNLANEVTEVLGGVDRRSDNWNCSLDSVNCPSVRLIKNANFANNDEARSSFNQVIKELETKGYKSKGISICEAWGSFSVYCEMSIDKDGKSLKFNAKQDFIGVDIEP